MRKWGVRPETRPPPSTVSTRTSSTLPTRASLRRALPLLLVGVQDLEAAQLLVSGTSSASRSAVVPGRGEYAKTKRPSKPTVSDELERRLELVLGLAGVADDDVAREGQVRDAVAEERDGVEVLAARV